MENFRDTISKIIYSEKKVLKSTIKKIDLNEIITHCLEQDGTNYAMKNRFILGLVKIYVRKYKYLLDEGNELLLKLSHRESIRVVKNKNINLKVNNNEYFVTDDLLEEKDLVPCDNDWPDFDNISVEAMRDESGLAGSTLIENLVEPLDPSKKKRKIKEDDITEYDANFYRKNICNVKNTVDLGNKQMKDFMAEEFRIADVFLKNILSHQNERRLSEVERMRDQTSIGDLDIGNDFDPCFDVASVDNSVEDSKYCLVLEQNDDFIFNSLVVDLPKIEKAKEFLKLLEMAGEGGFKCIQETPFSPILCKKK